jgi:hypothetical protein
MAWPEIKYTYPPLLEEWYRKGVLFRLWFNLYRGHLLFDTRMFSSEQIPHSGPLKNAYFFHEFFMGTQYLDAGYEALFCYREVESKESYKQASDLLGGSEAAKFICPNAERGGRPPDLLVFDPQTGALRFVECKGKSEQFSKAQPSRFAGIEEYLNQHLPPCERPLNVPGPRWKDLFPPLKPGQWLHVVRLVPSKNS